MGKTESQKWIRGVLGQGPVRLQPVAIFETRQLLAEPIQVRIKPPAPLATPASYLRNVYAEGFTITGPDKKKTVIIKGTDDCLATAGVRTGQVFTLDAWFNTDSTDVYQFQLRGAIDLKISIDGQPQTWPKGKEWWFVPVHLASGRHAVRIEGRSVGAKLDVRFGGPGSRRLDGSFCQHPKLN